MANIDYIQLLKWLAEGSLVQKTKSLKKLTILAVSGQKNFEKNIEKILSCVQQLIIEQQQNINALATLLSLEILSHLENQNVYKIFKYKIIKLLVNNLGAHNPSLRKYSHSCLVTYIKKYHDFDSLLSQYNEQGLSKEVPQQLQHKCINSFQSILIMESKCLDWRSQQLKKLFSGLLQRLQSNNENISKAANQCIISLCKFPEINKLIENDFSIRHLNIIKSFFINHSKIYPYSNVEYIESLIKIKEIENEKNLNMKQKIEKEQLIQRKQENYQKLEKIDNQLINDDEVKYENPQKLVNKKISISKQSQNPLSIQKSIRYDTPPQKYHKSSQSKTIPLLFNRKLIQNLKNEDNFRLRMESAEEILHNIQITKNKPEIAEFFTKILPIIIKSITDSNLKIQLTNLKILESMVDSIFLQNKEILVPILIEKLSEDKSSIRQNILRIIKKLFKTIKDKDIWIEEIVNSLKKSGNDSFKDEAFGLLIQFYSSQYSCHIKYNPQKLLDILTKLLTQENPIKRKIKLMQCIALISIKTKRVTNTCKKLQALISIVYYEMYLDKLQKLKQKYRLESNSQRKIILETTQIIMQKNQSKINRSYQIENPSLRIPNNNLYKNFETMQINLKIQNQQLDRVKRRFLKNIRLPKIEKEEQKQKLQRAQSRNKREISLQLKSQSRYQQNRQEKLKQIYFITKQDLKKLPDAEKEYKSILNQLKSKDTQAKLQAINKLRKIIEYSTQIISVAGSSYLHLIIVQLLTLIQNLPFEFAKYTLRCFCEIFLRLKSILQNEIPQILNRLLKKSQNANIFMNQQIKKCLITIIVESPQGKTLKYLFDLIKCGNKSINIKQHILNIMIQLMGVEKIFKKYYIKILQILVLVSADSQSFLQKKAKNSINEFCKYFKEWKKILRSFASAEVYNTVSQIMGNKNQNKSTRSTDNKNVLNKKVDLKQNQNLKCKNEIHQEKNIEQNRNSVEDLPSQFLLLDNYYSDSKSGETKQRIKKISSSIEIIKRYFKQFCSYQNNFKFFVLLSFHLSDSNIKIIQYCNTILIEDFQFLKQLILIHLKHIIKNIFNNLSHNKAEIRAQSEKLYNLLQKNCEQEIFLKYICIGCIFTVTKSRSILIEKLSDQIIKLYQKKNELFMKYIVPMIMKLLEEDNTNIHLSLGKLLKQIYTCMGESMYSLFQKTESLIKITNKS